MTKGCFLQCINSKATGLMAPRLLSLQLHSFTNKTSPFFLSRHHNCFEAKVLCFPVLEWLQKVQRDCCAVHRRNYALPVQHTKGKGSCTLPRSVPKWPQSCGFHCRCAPLLQSDSDRDHRVRLAMGNGIRADTWADFLNRFGDIRICECYGATEGTIGFINYIGKIGAIGKEHFLHKVHRVSLMIYFWRSRTTVPIEIIKTQT